MSEFSDHDIDCIIDLLVEAKEITKNEGIMNMVKERAKKRIGKISSIQDLKTAYNNVLEEKNEGENVEEDEGG